MKYINSNNVLIFGIILNLLVLLLGVIRFCILNCYFLFVFKILLGGC